MTPYRRKQESKIYIDRAFELARERLGDVASPKCFESPSKVREISTARAYVAAYLRAIHRNKPSDGIVHGAVVMFSLPHISETIGRKCHSTAVNALRNADDIWGHDYFDGLVKADHPHWFKEPGSDKLASDINRLLDEVSGVVTFHSDYGWEVAA